MESFSLFVYLALLIANILLILFWFGKHIELPLSLQSILMITTMFFTIRVCSNIKNKHQMKNRVFTGAVIIYLLANIPVFVDLVGLFALLTEAVLDLSQFVRNFNNKSTEVMSIAMVLMWTLGDTFKTCYFIQLNVPVQFDICRTLQITIDIAILFQVYLYQNNILIIRPSSRID